MSLQKEEEGVPLQIIVNDNSSNQNIRVLIGRIQNDINQLKNQVTQLRTEHYRMDRSFTNFQLFVTFSGTTLYFIMIIYLVLYLLQKQ